MRGYQLFYISSMVLSFLLTIAALITLLPIFGIHWMLLTPISTLILLGLVYLNCMIRAEVKRNRFGQK